jgi:NADH-ubiquinone oxidoreductase chain 5
LLSQYNLAVFHLVNHAFFKALLFLSAGAVIHAMHDEQDMRRLGGLGKILPFTYILMLIGSLSLMAVPFMTGFYSKDLIITASYGHYSLNGVAAYWLVTAGAALTAAYSARLLYYTFLTQPRGPKASYISSHEAPPVMAVPMAILALFAIFLGYLGQDLFIGMGSSLWNNALFQHPSHVIEAEFSVPVSFKVLPLIGCALAPALLLSLFIRYPKILGWLVTLHIWRTFYSFFNRSYFFDSLYAQIAGKFLDFGYITAKTIDRGVLELLGPYGLTNLLTSTASRLSYLDTGFLPHYASYMLIGLVGFLVFVLVFQNPKLLILVLCLVLLSPYLSSSSVTPRKTQKYPLTTKFSRDSPLLELC